MAKPVLLDTHSFIWMQTNNPLLRPAIRSVIRDVSIAVYLSAATCWEVVTKHRLGKLPVAEAFARDVQGEAEKSGLLLLPISFAHAQRTAALPAFHKDEFDRLLIAQALVEGMALASVERPFDSYGVERIS